MTDPPEGSAEAAGTRGPQLARIEAAVALGEYEIPAVDVADAIIDFHRGPEPERPAPSTAGEK